MSGGTYLYSRQVYKVLILSIIVSFLPQGDGACQIGDGVGGSEKKLTGSYTIQQCIDAVKVQYPTANGVTRSEPCPDKCSCYAEFAMTGWNSATSWQSCMFSNIPK